MPDTVIDVPRNPAALGRAEANQTLLALLMAMAAMLFAAFTASYVIRRTGADWVGLPLPRMVWVNTAALLAGSLTVELARRRPAEAAGWLLATLTLAVAFAAGQVLAWRDLSAAGLFASGNPHRAFFYVLTAVHGSHVAGGVAALIVTVARRRQELLGPCAIWWHFVGGLWLYILALLRFF